MNFNELEELLKPVLEEYANSLEMSIEELMLDSISLEDTKMFNVKDKKSIYYIFKKNKISNLKMLFELYDSNSIIGYNKDMYSKLEIDGILMLLKFKYLSIMPTKLNELLDNVIDTRDVNFIYKLLRMCGFDDFSSNILLNIINNYPDDISFGNFLYSIDYDKIKDMYNNNASEYNVFINIMKLINDYQTEYMNLNKIIK